MTSLFLVLLLGFFSVTTSQSCSHNTYCENCIRAPGCGWCADQFDVAGSNGEYDGKVLCVPGDEHGPHQNLKCPSWITTSCVATKTTCSSKKSCETCVGEGFCGWCEETQLCSEGDKNGPLHGTCKNFVPEAAPFCNSGAKDASPKPKPNTHSNGAGSSISPSALIVGLSILLIAIWNLL